MADDLHDRRQRNLQEALRLLGTLDLVGCHHLQQCANARVALLSSFSVSWWRRVYNAVTAKLRARLELFRSLRRDNARLRAANEKLRLQLLAARHSQ